MSRFAIVLLALVSGAVLAGAPCVISGYLAHAEESEDNVENAAVSQARSHVSSG